MTQVSVIIPVRDQAPRLRLTLAALERQDGVPPGALEVIVVDDGSSDELAAVVEDQARRAAYPLRLLASRSGGARGVPRNLGIGAARGALLLFLDADALPGRRLVAGHLAAHRGDGRLVAGDMFVLRRTELLRDPADGTPVGPVVPENPLVLPLSAVRAGLDDAQLAGEAEKGVYPGQSAWFIQLEEVLGHGGLGIAATGVIPHNLSMDRAALLRVDGFDPELLHFEGWDLGIRALRAGCHIGVAPGARSFHLFHARSDAAMTGQQDQARDILRKRYPDEHLDVIELWPPAAMGDAYVPRELGLDSWRGLVRALGDPTLVDECRRLARLWAQLRRPPSLLAYRFGAAINAPFPLAAPREGA